MSKVLATIVMSAFLVSVSAGSAAQSQESAVAATPSEGRTLFLTYCSSCHGTSAHGDGPVAEIFAFSRPI